MYEFTLDLHNTMGKVDSEELRRVLRDFKQDLDKAKAEIDGAHEEYVYNVDFEEPEDWTEEVQDSIMRSTGIMDSLLQVAGGYIERVTSVLNRMLDD